MPKRTIIVSIALCLFALAASDAFAAQEDQHQQRRLDAVYASGENSEDTEIETAIKNLPPGSIDLPTYSVSVLFGFCLGYDYERSGAKWTILDGADAADAAPVIFGLDFRFFFLDRWGIGLDMIATKISATPGEYTRFIDLDLLYRYPLSSQTVCNLGAGYTIGYDMGPDMYGHGYTLKGGYEYIGSSRLLSVSINWILHRVFADGWQTSLSVYCGISLWDEGIAILSKIF